MSRAMDTRPPKRLVIFCDGTWVGRETTVAGAPPSNIRQLANMVGEVQYASDPMQEPAKIHPIRVHSHLHSNRANGSAPNGHHFASAGEETIIAGYQEGVGLNRNFVDYIWDGATASAIGDECIAVYRFIVENYTS